MSNKKIIFLFFISISLVITGCDLFNFDKPRTPELLYVVQFEEKSVQVTWRNSEDADSYTVLWSEEDDTQTFPAGFSKKFSALEGNAMTVPIDITSFSIGKTFYFWVYAENSNGRSSISSYKKVSFQVQKSWTIMVWLDGDNSLDLAAKEDFHEMEAGLFAAQQADPDIMDNLNIIVQYDGRYGNYGRFEVQPRDINPDFDESNPSYGKISGGLSTEPNMGDAGELKNFIEDTKQDYPADNYALILWNHGGGVRSLQADSSSREICEDTTDNDILYIGEIKDVLEVADSVDFLGMDACLMGMTEIAYEFRPDTGDFSAQAMAFSPAEEQVDGWEYQNIVSRFGSINLDTMEAADFARIVVEEYEDAFSSYETETQTAVDLTKIAAVKEKVDLMARAIGGNSANKVMMESIRGSGDTPGLMHYFDDSKGYDWENYAGFDLYELADEVEASEMTIAVKNAAGAVKTAVEDAVLTSWAGSSYTGFENGKNGLSIFFPDGDAVDPNYGDSHIYWTYQYFYSSLTRDEINEWAVRTDLNYGALDFCTGDADSIVEGWFELLQSWYNPDHDTLIHPGPLW